jgi:hypothetical protein
MERWEGELSSEKAEIRWEVAQRLKFIEFRLFWEVSRSP